MPTATRHKLETAGLIITLVIAVLGFAQGWFVIPDHVALNTQAIKEMKTADTQDHDLMIRLNVQQEMMARDISEIKQAVQKKD